MKNKDTGLYPRVAFSCAFVVVLMLQTQLHDGKILQQVSAKQCIQDSTFDLTNEANSFSRQNLWFKDLMFIFNNFCYDMTGVALLYLWYKGVINSSAQWLTFAISAISKTIIQENMMAMLQPVGFNWYFPGLYAILVPFHDINDFYFSGHISNAAIFCTVLYGLQKRNPDSKMCRYALRFWLCFKLPYIWTMMTVTRTHYVIDLLSGIAYFGLSLLLGETLSYFTDVLLLGHKTQFRELLMYAPCVICGWSNSKPLLLIDNTEKEAQAHAFKKNCKTSQTKKPSAKKPSANRKNQKATTKQHKSD